jgi:transposase
MCWMNVYGQLLLSIFLQTVGHYRRTKRSCHVSVRTTQWKRDNHIPILPWPPQSSDLNIIENVWRTLKIHLKRRVNDIKTKQDLKDAVQDIWYKLPLHYIQSLFQSIPTRLRAVMWGKGQITKY